MLGRSMVLRGGLVAIAAAAALVVPLSVRACSVGATIGLMGVSPSVPSQSTVTVTGNAFGGPVRILWGSQTGQVLTTVPVAPGASFSVQVTIPAVADGFYYIYGDDGIGSATAPSQPIVVRTPATTNPSGNPPNNPPPTTTGTNPAPNNPAPVGQTSGAGSASVSTSAVGNTAQLGVGSGQPVADATGSGDSAAAALGTPAVAAPSNNDPARLPGTSVHGLLGSIVSGFAPSRAPSIADSGQSLRTNEAAPVLGIALAVAASLVVILALAAVPLRRRVRRVR